ncbi:hypothetical protein V6N12_045442 [Hibiscus sabdariffa]|uniref:Reverse transcriptase zinc-binding domain-containing protein n=1 Tax=Hibiscus sabdariffa TaxID=183260 RepID=A0ABR2G2T2_9ROSI
MDSRCSACGVEVETIDHVLHRCPIAHTLWCSLVRSEYLSQFFHFPFKDWIFANCTNAGKYARDGAGRNRLWIGASRIPMARLGGVGIGILWWRSSTGPRNLDYWFFERNLVVEVDSLEAIRVVQQGLAGQSSLSLAFYIVELLHLSWSVKLEHVLR